MKIDVDILGAFKNITIEPFENIIEFVPPEDILPGGAGVWEEDAG